VSIEYWVCFHYTHHSFACGQSVYPTLLIVVVILSLMCSFGNFIKDELIIHACAYFGSLVFPSPFVSGFFFMPGTYCFDDYSLVNIGWNQIVMLQSYSCLHDCCGYVGLLWNHINFRTFSISIKNVMRILIGIAFNLGNIDILTILNLPIHEHKVSFNLFMAS
jgi:hypothetical protein